MKIATILYHSSVTDGKRPPVLFIHFFKEDDIMAKAKKLPSGQWRTLVYDYTETLPDGRKKRHYKSFTADSKKESEYLAAQFALTKNTKDVRNNLTYGQALDKYIESREAVLSPSTIREYKRSRRNDMQSIMDIKIDDITQDLVQSAINEESKSHSPKTVKNMHGLLSAVLKTYRPNFALNTTLPQQKKPDIYVPTDEDIKTLISSIENKEMLIAVLLAAFGPMRRSEICALDSDHIVGNMVHVEFAIVKDENSNWVKKGTKSYAGDRWIDFPDFVIDQIRDIKGQIVHFNPAQISDRFIDIQRASGLPHFRFHDLRHYNASVSHALGIPDQYIMERGGWASDTVLKKVYRHTMNDKQLKMNNKINEHFSNMQHEMQHKK